MPIIRNITVDLGPREIVIGGKVHAMCDNIQVDVEEATEEELAELKSQPVILLIKPIDYTVKGVET